MPKSLLQKKVVKGCGNPKSDLSFGKVKSRGMTPITVQLFWLTFDLASNDLRIAREPLLPEPITQNDCARTAILIFRLGEGSA